MTFIWPCQPKLIASVLAGRVIFAPRRARRAVVPPIEDHNLLLFLDHDSRESGLANWAHPRSPASLIQQEGTQK
jgi:hypothetical protein